MKNKIERTRLELMNMMNNKGLGHFTNGTLDVIYSDAINYICQFCKDAGRQGETFGLCLKLQELQAKQSTKKEVLEILKKYKYNKNGSYDIKEKGNYTRISFALFLKELKKRIEGK